MTLYTLMNTLECVAISKPIEFYWNGEQIAVLNIGDHDDRYRAFISEYGLYLVKSLDIDQESASYLITL